MEQFALWRRTLGAQQDHLEPRREILRNSFLGFRANVALLVNEIGTLLPELTVHDITHLDALWRVADEIAGPNYPLNPAEAFVLGASFLLHDAAHVICAYDGGLESIKKTSEWTDLIAYSFHGTEPSRNSPEERSALFRVLRHLHAKQARQLTKVSWAIPGTKERVQLLENFELRNYYGDLIGEIAESHHWPPHRVVQELENRHVSAPAFLAPAAWSVDALKVAFLLRTADAAHIDGQRAPWFLFALRNPEGISQSHWKFQAKMGQPKRTEQGELRLTSGSPFDTNERAAWWLAYQTACMIDGELRAAQALMRDTGRTPFAVASVEYATTPEAFATAVRVAGWEPVNAAPKIGDVAKVIRALGGSALYGDDPKLALRELIQNGADAIRAMRALGGIEPHEGRIDISVTRDRSSTWLHITDTGIGMSRYVLTDVLLDFGNSLWSSETLLTELPGLASRGFKSVGRFGIGFFSVFMLGEKVQVVTRRFRKTSDDASDQWLLEFDSGLEGRPTLRRPDPAEELMRSGTRISVELRDGTFASLFAPELREDRIEDILAIISSATASHSAIEKHISIDSVGSAVARLAPTLDIEVRVSLGGKNFATAVRPNDWEQLPAAALLSRVRPNRSESTKQRLVDLREASGLLVGRVAYSTTYLSRAIVTHRGIQNGAIPDLVGVLLGHNSTDLARKNSAPIASSDAWARWADEWIGPDFKVHRDTLADLHALLPERDLPVYLLGHRRLTAVELSAFVQSESEIIVCDEMPNYDDYVDEVSRNHFEDYFEPLDDVLYLPSPRKSLADALKYSPINYAKSVETILQSAWGEFDSWEDEGGHVGDVEGTKIHRPVTHYTRINSMED